MRVLVVVPWPYRPRLSQISADLVCTLVKDVGASLPQTECGFVEVSILCQCRGYVRDEGDVSLRPAPECTDKGQKCKKHDEE